MESESKPSAPSFTWPLAPSKPRARTPITAKPPLAPLPRVPRASVPPPMVAEPIVAKPPVTPAWIEPVRVEPPPEPEPATLEDEPIGSMSTFGAGVLQARRGPNKFFIVAVLLAVAAIAALILR